MRLIPPLNLPAPGRRQCVYGALRGLARTCVFAKQSLGPIHCDLPELRSRRPSPGETSLLPKLRDQYAEFLDHVSLVHLRLLASPTCVGFRYGHPTDSLTELFLAADSTALGLGRSRLLVVPSRRVPPSTRFNGHPQSRCCFVPASLNEVKRPSGGAGILASSPSATPLGPRLRTRLTLR